VFSVCILQWPAWIVVASNFGIEVQNNLRPYFPDDHIQKYAALGGTPAVGGGPKKLRSVPNVNPDNVKLSL